MPEPKLMHERLEWESTITYLQRMKEAGFLFHGTASPHEILEFEPRLAKDPHDTWNADIAVYASNQPVVSTIFALYKGKESWGTTTKSNEHGLTLMLAQIPEKYKDTISQEIGTVYILPSSSFERRGPYDTQFKSKVPVRPLAKVKVKFQDYLDMSGTIEWMKGGDTL